MRIGVIQRVLFGFSDPKSAPPNAVGQVNYKGRIFPIYHDEHGLFLEQEDDHASGRFGLPLK